MATLSDLPLNQPATITHIHTPEELTRRLAAMGMRPGNTIRVLRRAWWGGPLQLRVGSTELLLRREHALAIGVAEVQP